jgi:hypothetical protein
MEVKPHLRGRDMVATLVKQLRDHRGQEEVL